MASWEIVLLVLGGPVVGWSFLCAIVDAIHARRAKRDLPTAARELGLTVTPTTRLPELHGVIDGFEVRVRDAAIEIALRKEPPWHASHLSFPLLPPHSWVYEAVVSFATRADRRRDFDFSDRVLDRYFRDRSLAMHSGPAPVPPELVAALRAFIARHGRFSSLIVGSKIHCAPMLGSSGPPKTHAISGSQVRRLVPDLLVLARALEAACPRAHHDGHRREHRRRRRPG